MAAVKVLHTGLCYDGEDWKCPTTSGSWRQVVKYLWPEVHKWARKVRWDLVGRDKFNPNSELMQTALNLRTGQAFGMASDQPELIEGAHADVMRFIYDEAKSIPVAVFDAVEGAFSTVGDMGVFAISTPGAPNGRFFDIHSRAEGYEDWEIRHVTLEEAIKAGRMDPEWVEKRRIQWGETSSLFKNHVLGEFAASEEDGVIPYEWIKIANDRWAQLVAEDKFDPFVCEGDDIARGGRDKTVRARRHGWAIKEIIYHDYADTMVTAGVIVAGLKNGGYAVVDVAGVGAGVYDRIQEQGIDVIPFNASFKSNQTDQSGELQFLNSRSLVWWRFREMLDPNSGIPIALPPDQNLIKELVAPTWRMNSSGKIQIESKDEIRKRIGRSTDSADAVITSYFDPDGQSIEFY
jgi:hypothetical protein